VPLLETPQGDLIPDSAVLMYYAQESTKDKEGVHSLIPDCPLKAAKMRLAQEEFNSILGKTGFWPAFGRLNWFDEEANATFGGNIDQVETFVKKFTDGKSFMSGTD